MAKYYLHNVEVTLEEFVEHRKQLVEARKAKVAKLDKITKLKEQLADTDYKAIKYAEGLYTDEEYESIKAEREALRVEIRKLQEGE